VTGTVRGTVTDPSGAVVPDAEVKITSEKTGMERTAKSNSSGEYFFPDLPVSAYRISAKMANFKEAVQTGIELHVGETLVVNVPMAMGSASEQVIVESSPFLVETTSGAVSGLITGMQVRELPLNGRSFVQLTTLMPGVSTGDAFDPKNKGLLSAVDISVSGGSSIGNLWTVDGANNNDVGSNRTILVFPSIDAIEEFRIHRNSYGPEFGQSGGAQINIVTRGGGNKFHGSAFYFGRNDVLNATDYFLNLGSQPKQRLRRNDFGYTFGGPILRDRLYFFAGQEWNYERRGSPRTGLVPSAEEKVGDFRNTCPARLPVDPLTGLPFQDGTANENIIPANRISPAGQLFMSLYPDANAADPCASPNFIGSVNTPLDWSEFNIRGDLNITKSTSLMMRFTKDSWLNNSPSIGEAGGLWGEDAFPAVDAGWSQPSYMMVAKLTTLFGGSAVNDFQFSWSGNRIIIEAGGDNAALNGQINGAVPTLFPENLKIKGADRPHFTHWGTPQGFTPLWHIAPWDNRQDLFAWRDDFSKVIGSHTLKAGFLYSRNAKDEQTGDESGESWGATGVNAWGGTTGNDVADYMLQDMAFGWDESRNIGIAQVRWRDLEFYAGDTWRVSRNLTLEYGLRWSLLRQPFLNDNRFASFDPTTFDPLLGGASCNGLVFPAGENPCPAAGFMGGTLASNRSIVENDNNNIAPRFGFAWDISGSGKTVIRGGIGQFFSRDRLGVLEISAANPPFNANIGTVRFLDSLTQPPNCAPNCSAATIPAPGAGLDPASQVPNNWQWNLTAERELWKNGKLEVGYVGSRGIHLLSKTNVNQVVPGDIDNNGVDDRLDAARAGAGGVAPWRPFGVFGDRNIHVIGHRGDSYYHSLQTLLSTKLHRGSIFQVAYTWSKLISTIPQGYVNNDDGFVDTTNFALDRGLDEFHRPHVFSANLIYNLPKLEDKNAFLRHLAGGWETSTIVSLTSGASLTVFKGGTEIPQPSGTGFGDNQRPSRVPGAPCRRSGALRHEWLNPGAFTFDGFQLGSIGNSPRGVCSGPSTGNIDLAFYKNFEVPFLKGKYFGEGAKLQFRLELFNAFNHPQFRNVDVGLGASNMVFDTGDLATANSIVSSTPSTTFGQARNTRGGREIQYALKLTF
jgi:hypothetical protein